MFSVGTTFSPAASRLTPNAEVSLAAARGVETAEQRNAREYVSD